MNATAWAALASTAFAFALSPIPLLELILVVMSKRRTVNSIAFVAALAVLSGVGVAIGAVGQKATSDDSGTSTTGGVLVLVLGLALLAVGLQNWRNRADTSEPAVLSKISDMGPAAVAFLALGATVLNPKNLVLLVAAGQTIAAADVSSGAAVAVGAVFVAVATLPYTLTAAYAVFGGDGAVVRLDALRTWLVQRNRLIMGVVAGLLGLLLVAKAAPALT